MFTFKNVAAICESQIFQNIGTWAEINESASAISYGNKGKLETNDIITLTIQRSTTQPKTVEFKRNSGYLFVKRLWNMHMHVFDGYSPSK